MTIQEKIEYNIDQIHDEVDFKMTLFNEGKYDKEHLRTVIRNVGMELKIINKLETSLIIDSLYFGIFDKSKLVKLYSSFQLSQIFPKPLKCRDEFSVCFYGWEIMKKFKKFEGEKGMFIFSVLNDSKTYHSSKFDGDEIEKKLKYLEDGEAANWGSANYYSLDIETTL